MFTPHEHREKMNAETVIEQALLAAVPILQGEVLAALGPRDSIDAIIELGRPGQDRGPFAVQVSRVERSSDLTWYRTEKKLGEATGRPLLLIAPYVSAKLAQECQRTGINFLDTAGNAYIDVPGMYLFITGKPRPKELRVPTDQSALRKASTMRVIFALLTIKGLAQQPVRAIAEAAGAAVGSTSSAIEDLKALGYIAGEARERRVANSELLQTEWAKQYPISLRDKLKPQRYDSVKSDWRENSLLFDEPNVALGGEAAAGAITGFIIPTTACFYSWIDRGQLLRKHRLRPDPGGPIEVLDAFWPHSGQAGTPAVAPLLLVYADLMASNEGRSVEVAGMLMERLKNGT